MSYCLYTTDGCKIVLVPGVLRGHGASSVADAGRCCTSISQPAFEEVVSKRYQKETVILVLPEVADDAGDRNEQADAVSMCVWVFVSVRQI